MESYLFPTHYDLVSPDGLIKTLTPLSSTELNVEIEIENISPAFVGFHLDKEHITFNLKSTLAQLGLNGIGTHYELNPHRLTATIQVKLIAYGKIAETLLTLLTPGAYIGKLFAADPRRRVRNPDYLWRMFGRTDQQGRPLLSLAGGKGKDELLLEKIEGRTVAFLELQQGVVTYDQNAIFGLLPTVAKALLTPSFRILHPH